jgi:hypothetical protein
MLDPASSARYDMRSALRLLTLLSVVAAPAAAQDPPRPAGIAGMTLDHWEGAGGPARFRPTLRLTRLPRGRPGLDLALTIFPDGISIFPPMLIVGLQGGLAQRIPLGKISLLVKGGAATIAAGGLTREDRFVLVIPGVQAGLGMLVPMDRRSSIQLDLTRHIYHMQVNTTSIWSFGFGVSGPWGKSR